jgi:iron complex outermembrane receptor protein
MVGTSIAPRDIGFRSNSPVGAYQFRAQGRCRSDLAGSGNIVHTLGNLVYAPVNLALTVNYSGVYAVDALNPTEALTLTAGFCALTSRIRKTRDRWRPNWTPAAATRMSIRGRITDAITEDVSAFGGYWQANRALAACALLISAND